MTLREYLKDHPFVTILGVVASIVTIWGFIHALENENNNPKASNVNPGANKIDDKPNQPTDIKTRSPILEKLINYRLIHVPLGKIRNHHDAPNSDFDQVYTDSIYVGDFYIGETEITQSQWELIMKNNPSFRKQCPDCPVENVTVPEIEEFIIRLNAKTGKNYQLPLSIEWEYAASGAFLSHQYIYSGSNNVNSVAVWNRGDEITSKGLTTAPVMSKLPNELGIYDMSGNVFEICSDPATGSSYEVAYGTAVGGSWKIDSDIIRFLEISTRGGFRIYRDYKNYYERFSDYGFRLSLPVQNSKQ